MVSNLHRNKRDHNGKNQGLVQDEDGQIYRFVHVSNPILLTSCNDTDGRQINRPITTNVTVGPTARNTPTKPIDNTSVDQQRCIPTFCNESGQQYYIMIQSSPSTSSSVSSMIPQSVAKVETVRHTNHFKRHRTHYSEHLTAKQDAARLGAAGEDGEGVGWAPNDSKRRVSHNEVEKRRRDKINLWIDKLSALVPMSAEEATKSLHSKGVILARTVDYVAELKAANSRLAKSLAELQQRLALAEQPHVGANAHPSAPI